METHDLGRLYATRTANLDRWSSPLQVGWTAETEEPYRQGRCLVLHLPGTQFGYAFGWWGRGGDEQKTLALIGVRDLVQEDLNETEEADW